MGFYNFFFVIKLLSIYLQKKL